MAAGPTIRTHHTELKVLGSPLTGSNWLVSSAPSIDSHHRVGVTVFEGRVHISRRYAIDWVRSKDGATFSGEALDPHSYYSYGNDVLAVADGTVATATDNFPDNVPRTKAGFRTAVPITPETSGGNVITLDLGGGQFAFYAHLQPGSLRVKTGDRVRRGQVLARVGGSGDAREPHLHFQLMTTQDFFTGEGVPYVIDRYRLKRPDGTSETRTREFPLGDVIVDFTP
jgi:hypothetical protein